MKTDSSREKINLKSAIILSIVSIIAGLIVSLGYSSILFAIIFIAICAGSLAALIHFECDECKALRFAIPTCVVVLDWIFNGLYSLTGVFIVVLALMMFLVYEQGWEKVESVLGMTLISSAMIVAIFLTVGMQNEQGISAIEFYKSLYEDFKIYMLNSMSEYGEIYAEIGLEMPSNEDVMYMFDYLEGMLISGIFVVGFVVVGVSSKAYSFILKKCNSDIVKLEKWRFMPTPVYAYFYIVLEFLTMFLPPDLTTYTLCVSNLNIMFMPIFLYMGVVAVIKMISERKKRGMPIAFTVICAFLMAMILPRVLIYIGVFYCIIANKIKKIQGSNN
jgi:hypothetical protein